MSEETGADDPVIMDADEAAGRASARAEADNTGQRAPEPLALCFFDPRHGSSTREVFWAPPAGVERLIAVCAADAARLAEGAPPVETGRLRPAAASLPTPRPPVRAAPADTRAARWIRPARRQWKTPAPAREDAAAGPSAAAGEVRRGRGSRELSLRRPEPQAAAVLVVRVTSARPVELRFKRRDVALGRGPLYARVPIPVKWPGMHFTLDCPGRWEVWIEPAAVLPSLGDATACLKGRGSDVVLDTGPRREVRISHRGRGPFTVHLLDDQFHRRQLLTRGGGDHDCTVMLPGGAPLEVGAWGEWTING